MRLYTVTNEVSYKVRTLVRAVSLFPLSYWLAVWPNGKVLASINVVALSQTRLVPGWVTVCGRVNHLGT